MAAGVGRGETIVDLLRAAPAGRTVPAALVRSGPVWEPVDWDTMARRVREIGDGLLALGVRRGERVALLAETRFEWTVCDLAIAAIGAVTVPVYPTASQADVEHVLRDSGSIVAIVEHGRHVRTLDAMRRRLPALRELVVIDEADGATSLDLLAARGVAHAAEHPHAYATAGDAVRPDDLLTVIYTSGTTGVPKGCLLLHRNYTAQVRAAVSIPGLLRPGERVLLYLPLAHTFARLLHFVPMAFDVTAIYGRGLLTLATDMQETRPHILPAVPRVLERAQARVLEAVAAEQGPRGRLGRWGLQAGREAARRRLAGERAGVRLAVRRQVADRLVLGKIRARFGGALRLIISGAAPLPPDVGEFFDGLGVGLIEGYGLTEATTVVAVNPPGRAKLGSVGPAFPGVELRLAAGDEVEVRGPGVFAGYAGAEGADTAEIVDGWLRTGDVGRLDPDGYLWLTDRKKDLLVTSGGKNVAPQPIELLLERSPLVAHAVVLGDARPHLVALLAVDPEAVAKLHPGADPADRAVRADLEAHVSAVNQALAAHERVRRFALLPGPLTIESGELTPTLKVRRRAVAERHRALVDALYG